MPFANKRRRIKIFSTIFGLVILSSNVFAGCCCGSIIKDKVDKLSNKLNNNIDKEKEYIVKLTDRIKELQQSYKKRTKTNFSISAYKQELQNFASQNNISFVSLYDAEYKSEYLLNYFKIKEFDINKKHAAETKLNYKFKNYYNYIYSQIFLYKYQ